MSYDLMLLWKEYREQRLRVALILLAGVVIAICWPMSDLRHPIAVCLFWAVLTIGFYPIFSSMTTAAGETQQRSLGTLAALPVSHWRIAAFKVFGGVLACAGLTLAGIVMLSASVAIRLGTLRYFDWELSAFAFATATPLAAAEVYLLMVIAAARAKTESAAAGVAALVAVGLLAAFLLCDLWVTVATDNPLPRFLKSSIPVSLPLWASTVHTHIEDQGYILIIWHVIITTFLAEVALWRVRNSLLPQGRVAVTRPTTSHRTLRPFRSPVAAMRWKSLREIRALTVCCLLAVVALGSLTMCILFQEISLEAFCSAFILVTVYTLILFITIFAVGPICQDLRSEKTEFWRARPIALGTWYWSKFFSGIAGILPLCLLLLLANFVIGLVNESRVFIFGNPANVFLLSTAMIGWCYTFGIFLACLFRHAVYAALINAGLFYFWMLSSPDSWINSERHRHWMTGERRDLSLTAIYVAAIGAAILLAVATRLMLGRLLRAR